MNIFDRLYRDFQDYSEEVLCMDYNSIVYMYNHSLCIDESLLLFPLLHATIDECSTCL